MPKMGIRIYITGMLMRRRRRANPAHMGRKPRGLKLMTFWMPREIGARIDVVLRKGETRSEFIRAAIEAALRRRKPRRSP